MHVYIVPPSNSMRKNDRGKHWPVGVGVDGKRPFSRACPRDAPRGVIGITLCQDGFREEKRKLGHRGEIVGVFAFGQVAPEWKPCGSVWVGGHAADPIGGLDAGAVPVDRFWLFVVV